MAVVLSVAGCVQNQQLIGPFDMDDDITSAHLHRRYELMTLIKIRFHANQPRVYGGVLMVSCGQVFRFCRLDVLIRHTKLIPTTPARPLVETHRTKRGMLTAAGATLRPPANISSWRAKEWSDTLSENTPTSTLQLFTPMGRGGGGRT